MLYGERRNSSTPEAPDGLGGHGPGYGWIFELAEGVPRTEFPRDWSHKDIVHAIDETIARGKPNKSGSNLAYEHTVDGVPIVVATGRRKHGGPRHIRSVYPDFDPRK
ncbi:EndoU domain-containing protein [Auritidibacter ignavus]|uniref:EndoU domain-containing protein n=1 Tax=Auritidibacter ignavus TaxID=678932 RepID=UPI00109C20CA